MTRELQEFLNYIFDNNSCPKTGGLYCKNCEIKKECMADCEKDNEYCGTRTQKALDLLCGI